MSEGMKEKHCHKNGPFRIRLLTDVRSEMPFVFPCVARAGEHDAWCNRFGAVWVVADDGSDLGVRPAEFEYITFPPAGIPLAVTPDGARRLVDSLLASAPPAGNCLRGES